VETTSIHAMIFAEENTRHSASDQQKISKKLAAMSCIAGLSFNAIFA